MYSGVFILLFTPTIHFYLPLFPARIKLSTLSSLRTSVASMLPWGLQGFSCLKSAVYTGTVWKQHGAPEHPLPPMPLNQSKPPLSFLLYSAFAFLYFFPHLCCPLLLRVIGVRQTCCVQVHVFVPAFLWADEQMNRTEQMNTFKRLQQHFILYFHVFHIQKVCICLLACFLSPRSLAMHLSLISLF